MQHKTISPSVYTQQVSEARGALWGKPMQVKKEAIAFFNPQLFTDPVSLGFRVYFNFDSRYGLLAGVRDGKAVPDQELLSSYRNSALAYFKRIGDTNRFSQLVAFINHLKRVSSELSFLFYDIDGLDDIRKAKPFHRFDGSDKITLKGYETLDFAIQSISDLYSMIWKDDIGWREVLPANLRRFSCSIFVYATGSYQVVYDKTIKPGIYDIFNGGQEQNVDMGTYVMNVVPNNIIDEDITSAESQRHLQDLSRGFFIKAPDRYNHVMYELSECEFLPHESGSAFASPSNKSSEYVDNDLSFSFRWASKGWKFSHLSMVPFSNFILSQLQKPEAVLTNTNKFDLGRGISKITSLSFLDKNPYIKSLAEKAYKSILPDIQANAMAIAEKYGSIDKLKKQALSEITRVADHSVLTGTNKLNQVVKKLINENVYSENYLTGLSSSIANAGVADTLIKEIGKSRSTASINSSKKLKDNENVYEKL